MVVDASSLPQDHCIETDVCIVGSGTAGLTLAREFTGKNFRVCLLESGGQEPDRETQALYWGENVGLPYFSLDTARARYFGGSTNRWHVVLGNNVLGARMRPLDPIDFEEREGIPYSGWPFDWEHINPFYDRAQSLCQIGPPTYEVDDWADPEKSPPLPFIGDRVKTVIFKIGSRDPFIRDYSEQVKSAPNIDVYLHANVLEIETDDMAETVTRLSVASLGGARFWVSARLFILATGGIEVPRLLLLSNKIQKTGLGNQNDLVGRFFMEHVHFRSGIFVPSDPDIFTSTGLYNEAHKTKNVSILGKLSLAAEVLRQEKLANYSAQLMPRTMLSAVLYRNVGSNRIGIFCGKLKKKGSRILKKKIKGFVLAHMTEQVPNPNSRVMLAAERDSFGQNRVHLDWQLSPVDIRSTIRAQEIIDEEIRRAGLGRLHIQMKDDAPPPGLGGGYHHMGTTRMHVDPQKGVVDENCRVHGISNLFVAGPSVFPTGGYANPVLTILALAIRLADYVENLMSYDKAIVRGPRPT